MLRVAEQYAATDTGRQRRANEDALLSRAPLFVVAEEDPQRSVITRALGPEGTVDVDTRSFRARAGDVYLLCSDGLTTMVSEEELAGLLREHPHLRDAGEALIAAANEAGGRDNITVVLVRLEEVGAGARSGAPGPRRDDAAATGLEATMCGAPPVPA